MLLRWMGRHIAEDGKRTKWVQNMSLPIRKATLSFAMKFLWLLVRTRLSATQADDVVTWDRAVMIAAIMAGLELYYSRILIVEIYDRDFRTTTNLPFPCLIFHLCMEFLVPIWHCDKFLEGTKTVDIDLIRDDVNLAAPWGEPQVDVPQLGAYLATDVEHLRADDNTFPAPTIDAHAPPSTTTSHAPELIPSYSLLET
ncbi:hypothetical protein MTR67_043845 [Solanum verrucosum]|uniref:Putative plant transposon protein domain-containing protein n=1 Tax=Solanum verrucosum TaxID=315347 RepID=A0AAF0UR30_SOLVR|nr:hypothetical protein MTR67_043845 [Solanum verrucosum]